ncbi:Alpha/Beta hydrolase protein [Catenaria anguillulae PL171]|uniref:Proline iminopeptidase n=1 Tax=Catenaria anguillulae PL171 TaxID=765915 RepID=A0A1Y2HX16_9FUNG|nr:Alpha/Beta hydrolase protein [Catenaria anguillulae PL171]
MANTSAPASVAATVAAQASASPLYPEIEPFNTGFLSVSGGHNLYYEESGNPQGNPVIYLHGGPGGGVAPSDRRYFDPAAYRIILLDQRGAGKSTPAASLVENTTQHLTNDVELLRQHLKIDRWVVFGGSWGSTLAMCYAQAHPHRVKALILRGIFTVRRSELEWLYEKGGAEQIYPDAWEGYVAPIPEEERNDMIGAYYKRLTGTDEDEKLKCAKAWSAWEMSTSRLVLDPEVVKKVEQDIWSLQFARIECHYFKHNGFMEDNHVLDNVDKIRHIPCSIIQGRYDVVCPAITSWQLHKRWPEADYQIVQLSGHSARDLVPQLVAAADKYKHAK